jgi:capsular polysaccharide transport system permease protein
VTGSLAASFAIQRRVIWALLMRELITRFGRHNIGVLWLVAEPMIFTVGVAGVWTAAGFGHGSAMPVAAFAITGYSSVLMWRNTVSKCNAGIQQNFNLLYHRNVRVMDVFATRIILELGGTTASFVLLATLMVATGFIPMPVDLLTSVFGWLLLAWFGAALATLVGAAASFSEIIDRIWHPISYFLFPLSGAAFMVDWFAQPVRDVLLWLPMVHGVEMVRDGFYGHLMRTHYDVSYVVVANLLLSLFGLLVLRAAGQRVRANA